MRVSWFSLNVFSKMHHSTRGYCFLWFPASVFFLYQNLRKLKPELLLSNSPTTELFFYSAPSLYTPHLCPHSSFIFFSCLFHSALSVLVSLSLPSCHRLPHRLCLCLYLFPATPCLPIFVTLIFFCFLTSHSVSEGECCLWLKCSFSFCLCWSQFPSQAGHTLLALVTDCPQCPETSILNDSRQEAFVWDGDGERQRKIEGLCNHSAAQLTCSLTRSLLR